VAQTGFPPRRGAGGERPGNQALPSRRERAKARTRSALIRAAQRFIVEGQPHVPILEITQSADVGLGSFYNHFESRDALFAAATDDALEALGGLLDQLGAGFEDPAEVFAQSFRLTGRLFRSEPLLMQVALGAGPALLRATSGLVPRARREIEAGLRTGRFTVRDPEVALAIVVGSVLCLGELLSRRAERDADSTTDAAAAAILRMLGLAADEADRISSQPLPHLSLDVQAGRATSGRKDTSQKRPTRRQPDAAAGITKEE
jgi:AcrR family transcriptional regulator